MNFSEATAKLKEGCAVRRKCWEDCMYIQKTGIHPEIFPGVITEVIRCYRQFIVPFNYDISIILSEDWVIVDDEEDFMTFPEAMEILESSDKVKLKSWPKHTYLELHPNGRELYMRKMEDHHYTPTFDCFVADDWELAE